MRAKYNLQETFLSRTKVLRRWDVSKQKLDQIMDRHNIKPTLIGCRHKYKMSDIARIEADMYGCPIPKVAGACEAERVAA
jgi:hypothetical protein